MPFEISSSSPPGGVSDPDSVSKNVVVSCPPGRSSDPSLITSRNPSIGPSSRNVVSVSIPVGSESPFVTVSSHMVDMVF